MISQIKKNHKRIVLVGKGGSGKDYAKKILSKKMKCSISYTTRPQRKEEIDGVDYFFISNEKFKEMINNNEFYIYSLFNKTWYYGILKKQFYSDDVFIMSPNEIRKLEPDDRKNTYIVYFDIPQEIRKERLMKRNDADIVNRRIESDEIDFENFKDFDIKISNSHFNMQHINFIIKNYKKHE